MIGIDTYSWTKIFKMIDEGWDQIFKNILDQMQFFIAKEVLKELEHFHIAKENYWSKGIILKTLNKSFNVYIRQEFDETDASLLEYSELNDFTIVTEDGSMLAENTINKNNITQLIDLLINYYKLNIITRVEIRMIIKIFRKKRNITIKKERRLNLFVRTN